MSDDIITSIYFRCMEGEQRDRQRSQPHQPPKVLRHIMKKQPKVKSKEAGNGVYSRFVRRFSDMNCSKIDIESVLNGSVSIDTKELSPQDNGTMSNARNNGTTDMASTSSTVSVESDSDFDEVSAAYPFGKASLPADEKSQTTETMVQTSDSSSASSESESDCDSSFDDDRRKVHFSNVSIRSYSLTLGDSPAMKSYALSLDWAHTPTETLDIDIYEELYSSAQTKPFTNGRMVRRGFRLPARLKTADRFALLTKVTGQSPEDLYELNRSHLIQQHESVASDSDSLVDKIDMKKETIVEYEVVDADEFYQMVDL
jgi:hypothetical protein